MRSVIDRNVGMRRLTVQSLVIRSTKLLSGTTKVSSEDPKGSVTTSQGIRGYISLMATLKFTYFLNY